MRPKIPLPELPIFAYLEVLGKPKLPITLNKDNIGNSKLLVGGGELLLGGITCEMVALATLASPNKYVSDQKLKDYGVRATGLVPGAVSQLNAFTGKLGLGNPWVCQAERTSRRSGNKYGAIFKSIVEVAPSEKSTEAILSPAEADAKHWIDRLEDTRPILVSNLGLRNWSYVQVLLLRDLIDSAELGLNLAETHETYKSKFAQMNDYDFDNLAQEFLSVVKKINGKKHLARAEVKMTGNTASKDPTQVRFHWVSTRKRLGA